MAFYFSTNSFLGVSFLGRHPLFRKISPIPLDKFLLMRYNELSIDISPRKDITTMAKDKFVEQITSMDVDFAQWYSDVV